MSARHSRDTVIANVAQQGSALLLLLAIPNLLSVEHYAEVVFVGVVLSFTRFSDLGLSLVFGRDAPRHHALEESEEIELWGRTLFWFGMMGAAVAGCFAAIVMYLRFGTLADASIVLILPLLSSVVSTYVSMASVRSDFRAYRNSQVGLSISRLLAIPLALPFGVLGWLAAQIASLVLVISGIGVRWIPVPPRTDWDLVRRHLPAALQLALISLLWVQLLDSARLLASIYYPPEGIAIYGILVAGYQSVYSLVISAYLPVSVRTLGLLGKSDREAAEYVFGVINRTVPAVFVLVIVAAELSPWLLELVFPKYSIDPLMPKVILYGLTVLPFAATLGNLFVGKRKTGLYLAMLTVAFSASAALEQLLRPEVGIRAAAIAQATGTAILALLMVVASRSLFAHAPRTAYAKMRAAVVRLGVLWAVYLILKVGFS